MKNALAFRFVLSVTVFAFFLLASGWLQPVIAQTDSTSSDGPAIASDDNGNAATASTLPPDIDPNSPLAQVVSLAQAGVEESVILNYINNSTGLFNLDADKIIYLNDLGVPTDVINTMMQHDEQLEQAGITSPPAQAVSTTEAAAQPAEVTVNYFYSTLAPYGSWVDVAGYGWCWRPSVVVYDPGWQPYCNNGHWVYTDHGWFWMSGYSWGWATFHYGRWFNNARYGWCWWPDTTWGPSWVCWRYNDDYCGWAPLPPHAIYRPGLGLVYNGHTVSAGFHFGLSVNAFTFVRTRDFCDREPWHHRIEGRDMDDVYHHTRPFHHIDFDRHNDTAINPGIPVHNIRTVTGQPIHPVAVHYQVGTPVRGNRHERFEHGGNTVVVSRPHFVGSPVLTPHRGPAQPAGSGHVQFRESNPAVRSPNPAQNNFQRSTYEHPGVGANQSPNANFNRFNRVNPQTPQTRRPAVPHVGWPSSPSANKPNAIPRQNLSPNQGPTQPYSTPRYPSYDNRNLSPRSRGFEQQSPRGMNQNRWQENQQHFSAPAANRYSAPIEQRQNQYRPGAFQTVPRNGPQHFNRSEPRQQAVPPHPGNQSPSSPAQHNSNDNRDQNDRH